MKVGLCDDNLAIRDMVRRRLNQYHPEVREIYEFLCGEALIEYLRLKTLDMVFLDCVMNGLDGIETAEIIRQSNTKLIIIILTDYMKYAMYGYNIGAYKFILKEQFQEKIDAIYKSAVKHAEDSQAVTFTARTNRGMVQTKISDILYIESIGRKRFWSYAIRIILFMARLRI